MKRFKTNLNGLPVFICYEYDEVTEDYEILEVLPVYGSNILPMLSDEQYGELVEKASMDRVN